jgi:hypothetical protein
MHRRLLETMEFAFALVFAFLVVLRERSALTIRAPAYRLRTLAYDDGVSQRRSSLQSAEIVLLHTWSDRERVYSRCVLCVIVDEEQRKSKNKLQEGIE